MQYSNKSGVAVIYINWGGRKMAEYPQRNRSASEYLEMMAELVPFFNDLIAGDVGV